MKRLPSLTTTGAICIALLLLFHFPAYSAGPHQSGAPQDGVLERHQDGTPVPDSGYDGSNDDSPSLFEFFRRLIITDTPTPTPGTPTPYSTPTRTPRPTSTPVFIPPPSDPEYLRLMIALGGIMVIVILIGVWINREHRT